METKVCAKCEIEQPVADFPRTRKYISWCRQCYRDDHQRRRSELMFTINGVTRSGLQLRRKYKLSPEQYVDMYEEQSGLCAICHKAPESNILVVDHNHETGQIRDLLCKFCNWAIGQAREDPEILKSIIAYLEHHNER